MLTYVRAALAKLHIYTTTREYDIWCVSPPGGGVRGVGAPGAGRAGFGGGVYLLSAYARFILVLSILIYIWTTRSIRSGRFTNVKSI